MIDTLLYSLIQTFHKIKSNFPLMFLCFLPPPPLLLRNLIDSPYIEFNLIKKFAYLGK